MAELGSIWRELANPIKMNALLVMMERSNPPIFCWIMKPSRTVCYAVYTCTSCRGIRASEDGAQENSLFYQDRKIISYVLCLKWPLLSNCVRKRAFGLYYNINLIRFGEMNIWFEGCYYYYSLILKYMA